VLQVGVLAWRPATAAAAEGAAGVVLLLAVLPLVLPLVLLLAVLLQVLPLVLLQALQQV
jgi:hypothetical protein